MLATATVMWYKHEYNINHLLVCGPSASSPIKKTTPVAGATRTRTICSVCLCSVGRPGACPDNGIEKWQTAVIIIDLQYKCTDTIMYVHKKR